MEVTVYGPLRAATRAKTADVPVDGDTVGAVITAFVDAYPRAESQLVDADGALRPSVRVMVDGASADRDEQVPPGASVELFPAMRGG
ncbi:ubiquitin-like small modifier protein 1 [Haloarcula japonica]|uniref:Sulfur carrier protein ThiS n=1 Tax=Haloarcula japonica (strain ATCC 49778 / DSM 6131 / JCM 7785 / NBRC 101032 / NCIMB 13157 / TR-1) TaxID=1227453 RepID=M0LES9_HALJT|nr:ubiquitin-like small modifier protein 1 [Haloarcula japonica]EMA30485.1 sulfur carrier protein ThiS [Haloarcula japonica DSM 6131]